LHVFQNLFAQALQIQQVAEPNPGSFLRSVAQLAPAVSRERFTNESANATAGGTVDQLPKSLVKQQIRNHKAEGAIL
jgi:hypothetical protein